MDLFVEDNIKILKFKMQSYLFENKKTKTSRTIYKIRSGTLDLKALAQWKHSDNVCVMCELKEENLNTS